MNYEEFKNEPVSGELEKVGDVCLSSGGLSRWDYFFNTAIVVTGNSQELYGEVLVKTASMLADMMCEEAYTNVESV